MSQPRGWPGPPVLTLGAREGKGAHALIIHELEGKSRLLGDVIHGEYGVA